jgi:KDO2-lipid IV(A) lauroyltransferase
VKLTHRLEVTMVRALAGELRRRPWPEVLKLGARLGNLLRALGIRRTVAEENLAIAFPGESAEDRAAILASHYRELGRVAAEYPRLGYLVKAGPGEVVAEVTGLEHLEAAQRAGRGAILLTGHYGHFELLGAWLGRIHPVDFVVKPLSNPGVEAMLAGWRVDAGVGSIPLGAGLRRVFEALRANRWVAMLADQDARSHGAFVPFFGRRCSTPKGPAELAIRTGAPIIMGFPHRAADGRHTLDVHPPLELPDRRAPGAVETLTARHTAMLEGEVRKEPAPWFWLHRRWKTPPPEEATRRT